MFDLMFASVGPKASDVTALLGKAAAAVAELPANPGVALAKALANRDPDVLVDMSGLGASAGPLLAHHPAREIWAVAVAPGSHVPPLVDRTIGSAEDLVAALAAARAALATSRAACPIDAASLAAAWEAGVRAHQRGDRDARVPPMAGAGGAAGVRARSHLTGILARDSGDAASARHASRRPARGAWYIDARLAARGDGTARSRRGCCDLHRWPRPNAANVGLRALGHAHLRAATDGCATAFERALAIEPTDADTHYNLGVALQMRRSPLPAARAYRQALALIPDCRRPTSSRRRAPGGRR
jgi:hypothetical protein